MKKGNFDKAINFVNELKFVKERQLKSYLKLDDEAFNTLLNKLYINRLTRKIEMFKDSYIVPYQYQHNEENTEKMKSKIIENGKAIDLLIHISKRNCLTNFYLSNKPPVNIVFICEFTDRNTNKKENKMFEIICVNKGNESTSNILADRLLYVPASANGSLTPVNFIVVDDEEQVEKLRIENVGGYFTVNDDGTIDSIA